MEQTAQTCAYQPGCKPSYATDLDGTMLTQHWPGCLTSVDLHVIAGAGWCCGCALTQCFSFSSNSDRSTLGAKSAGTLQSLADWRLLCKRKARPKDIMADGKHWNVPVAADRPRRHGPAASGVSFSLSSRAGTGSGWTGASLAIVLGVSYVMYGMSCAINSTAGSAI